MKSENKKLKLKVRNNIEINYPQMALVIFLYQYLYGTDILRTRDSPFEPWSWEPRCGRAWGTHYRQVLGNPSVAGVRKSTQVWNLCKAWNPSKDGTHFWKTICSKKKIELMWLVYIARFRGCILLRQTSSLFWFVQHHRHCHFSVHFLPRLNKGMDGCFPTT